MPSLKQTTSSERVCPLTCTLICYVLPQFVHVPPPGRLLRFVKVPFQSQMQNWPRLHRAVGSFALHYQQFTGQSIIHLRKPLRAVVLWWLWAFSVVFDTAGKFSSKCRHRAIVARSVCRRRTKPWLDELGNILLTFWQKDWGSPSLHSWLVVPRHRGHYFVSGASLLWRMRCGEPVRRKVLSQLRQSTPRGVQGMR